MSLVNSDLIYWICGISVTVSIICVYFSLRSSGNVKGEYKLKQIITNNEKDCYFHLQKCFPDSVILAQVSMGAVLDPMMERKSKKDASDWMVLRNKISSKIIDFIIMDKDLNPMFIVELDDKSHDNKVEEDKMRDFQLREAGLKTVRFRRENGKFPSKSEILDLLSKQNKK